MNLEPSEDAVGMYLREMETISPLTNEQILELFREMGQWGDWDEKREAAAKKLIEAHLPLVVEIANKHRSTNILMLDLIQEGNIGLMRAVAQYAETPAGEFRTYAAARIEEAIQKAVSNAG